MKNRKIPKEIFGTNADFFIVFETFPRVDFFAFAEHEFLVNFSALTGILKGSSLQSMTRNAELKKLGPLDTKEYFLVTVKSKTNLIILVLSCIRI